MYEYDKQTTALELMMDFINENKYWVSEEFKKKYEELLELEKRQIASAFCAGEFNMMNSKRDECFEFQTGGEYYNAIFKQDPLYICK